MKDITIQNMVASVDLFSSKIPLTKFVKEIENVTYNPKKFPGACLRLEKPRTSILVFDSGKIVVSGAKNEKDIKKSIKELRIYQNTMPSFTLHVLVIQPWTSGLLICFHKHTRQQKQGLISPHCKTHWFTETA